MIYLVTAILAYLFGSLPSGYLVGRFVYKKDIRKMGSGNVGTTNAFRNFGKCAGILTFALDFLKGFIACFIANWLLGENALYIAMIFVVLGHMFSFILKFKAGKGVATIFGCLMYIDFKFALSLFMIFLILFLLTRIVSFASVSLCVIAIVYGIYEFGISKFTMALSFLAIIILIKHKDNIKRLRRGEEKKIF